MKRREVGSSRSICCPFGSLDHDRTSSRIRAGCLPLVYYDSYCKQVMLTPNFVIDSEVLHFAGRDRTINSIVLLSNGISFAIQIVVFLVIGSYAGQRDTSCSWI